MNLRDFASAAFNLGFNNVGGRDGSHSLRLQQIGGQSQFSRKTLSINIGCLIVMFVCLIIEFFGEIWPYVQTCLLF